MSDTKRKRLTNKERMQQFKTKRERHEEAIRKIKAEEAAFVETMRQRAGDMVADLDCNKEPTP